MSKHLVTKSIKDKVREHFKTKPLKVEMTKVDEKDQKTSKVAITNKDTLDAVILDLIGNLELGAAQKEVLISRIRKL